MGVQSFKFPVDFLNNLEKPIIYIANKHKEILNSVSVYGNLSLTCNLNAFQTASFKIYRDVDGKKQDYFKLFEEEMLIMIPGVSWYEIHVETNIEQTGISKSITANSLEVKLCDKRLVDFQVNSDDFEDDDYVVTKFYNPTEPKKSLLNRVLNVSPAWTVGHVDQSLWDIQRTFDESDIDVYSFLTGTVSEAFNCLFTFDTFNQTVNAYDLKTYGINTNIFVSMDNLAQNMTETIDENSIFTCYRVTGGEDIQIAEVNPNGTNKIYNFEYYLPMMPTDLQAKVKQYNAKYQELKPKYEDIVKRLGDQIAVIQELNTRYPDSLASKDWTQYGLSGLETYKKSFETQNQLFCAQGMNKPDSLNYNLYKQNLEDLKSVTAEYNKRISEINDAMDVYQSIVAEMKTLQSELDMNVWFTEDEWKILDSYVIEQTYSNDNFGAVDNTTEAELFTMEKELYDKAWKDLSKKCRPQYQYSSTLANVLTIPEFKNFIQYFELGNFIRMETDYDTIIKLRIISFTVDYTNTQTISVTFSDAIRVKDVYEDASSIQAQVNSAAMSFQFNKDQYDKTVKEGNWVAQMRKYGLDVATTQIYNATDQSQTWDSTGMAFRKWNDERQDYDPEMIKIINNMIVFSDDGFQTSKMAIGKIPIDKSGNYVYAVNAEAIMGKFILGEYLTIQNNSGTYIFNDSGFSASNGTNTIKIQPNNSNELFSIYKGSEKQIYINSDGDAIFSGLLSGGSINLGGGVFTVDKNGNMIANSGVFKGNIEGATINSSKFISSNDTGSTVINNSTIVSTSYIGSSDSRFSIIYDEYSNNLSSYGMSLISPTNTTIYANSFMKIINKNGKETHIDAETISTGSLNLSDNDSNFIYKCNGSYETTGIPSMLWIKQHFNTSSIEANYINSDEIPTTQFITFSNVNSKKLAAATPEYVQEYVARHMPNTNEFAPIEHDHDYIAYATYNFENSPTTKYAPRYFNKYYDYDQNEYYLKVDGLLISTSSSDKRLKNNIQPLRNINDFYMRLIPVEYVWKDGYITTQKGLQFGLIAQDVEIELQEYGISNSGLVLKEFAEDDEKSIHGDEITYKLDKEQLHAMHIQMIQKHEREIESLKQQISKLKETIKNNGKTE